LNLSLELSANSDTDESLLQIYSSLNLLEEAQRRYRSRCLDRSLGTPPLSRLEMLRSVLQFNVSSHRNVERTLTIALRLRLRKGWMVSRLARKFETLLGPRWLALVRRRDLVGTSSWLRHRNQRQPSIILAPQSSSLLVVE
jgi:hypothetical protein